MSAVAKNTAKIAARTRALLVTALLGLAFAHANSAAALSAPTVTVSLSPQTVLEGGMTTVSVTLTNPNASVLTAVADTTTMPLGLTPVASIGTTCGGVQTINAVNGGTSGMSSGTLTANGSCSFSFSARPTAVGAFSIPTGSPSASGTAAGVAGQPVTLTVNKPLAPTTSIVLAPSGIYSGGTSTFTVTITNPNNVPLAGVNDTVYPAPGTSFVVALGSASCTNGASVGVLSVSAGGYSANFTMTPNSSCMFDGTITSTTPGSYLIYPGQPIATGALPGSTGAPATLTVNPLLAPTAAVVVAPTSITSGGQAVATITLTNPNSVALSGVGDSVVPPSGTSFVVALQPGTCNGTQGVSASAFAMGNATLAAHASCTIAYAITSSTAGTYPVASGTTSATGASVSSPGPTTPLIVKPILAPIATVSLAPASIDGGGQSLATVTLTNPNSVALSGVGDTIFPPLFTSFVASLPGGTCNGTSTATAGSFQLTGATLAANASCTISYLVTSSTPGSFLISTGNPSATGTVNAAPGVSAYLNVTIAQAVSFQSSAPVNNAVGGTYTPVASASSGLPVKITVAAMSSAVCSISSGVVTFNGPGSCILDANQSGNSTFSAAAQVQQVMGVQGPPIEVTIYDQSNFVAYGANAIFNVIVVNLGASASSGIAVSTSVSAGLDGAAAQWTCIASVGGAVCPADGTGLLSAIVNLPAGSGLEWQWTVPVRLAGTAPAVTASVGATGALSEQDIDEVVVFRGDFE